MINIETQRKKCLSQQTKLRQIMMEFNNHDRTLKMFIEQHSLLHSSMISNNKLWSFEDAIFENTSEEVLRRIPINCTHSVLWNIWHLARIEDVTMNILVADDKQVLNTGNWNGKMNMTFIDTGNCMSNENIQFLSKRININQLRMYRLAVGRRTQEIVSLLKPDDLKLNTQKNRLIRIMEEGALVKEANSIGEYWGKRNIAGLLLMPATRHNIIHLNEALQLKQRKK